MQQDANAFVNVGKLYMLVLMVCQSKPINRFDLYVVAEEHSSIIHLAVCVCMYVCMYVSVYVHYRRPHRRT